VRVLLVGATGFTGRRIARELVGCGHHVRCFVRRGSDRGAIAGGPFEFVVGDLDDPATLLPALRGAEALVSAASIGFGHGPGIVGACETAGVRRAVFFGSTSIFTALPSAAKETRIAAEDAIRDSGLEWTILRPTMIYGGPGDRNVERLLRAAARWPAMPVVGRGSRLVQPVFVDDLAVVAVRALDRDRARRGVYVVPGARALSQRDLFREAFLAVGRRPRLVSVPASLAVRGARMVEILFPKPPVRAEQVLRLLEDKDFEFHAARRDLGYDPVDPVKGLRIEAERLGLGVAR
jgi:uncharacterized protein YbjT (DUF2867 family)